MTSAATPISIIETYFDLRLDRKALKRFDELSEDQWVDFAKHYLGVMNAGFSEQFLAFATTDNSAMRLYFEPRMSQAWGSAVNARYQPTPLLGVSPHPQNQGGITRDEVSTMLNPLKKHLLLADSVYFRDGFYSCFDAVADSVDRYRWRSEPNVVTLVELSIQSLKRWLPILVELRELIECNALVFMPYSLTPSFPYGGDAPTLKPHLKKVRLRARQAPPKSVGSPKLPDLSVLNNPDYLKAVRASVKHSEAYCSETDVLGAWLNARILQLDPVFPNRSMFDWAAALYFADDLGSVDLTSDLISLSILPFGGLHEITLDDLISMRKNEEVFKEVQRVTAACKGYIEANLGTHSTQEGVSAACKMFLQDQLGSYERGSVLKFVDENPVAGVAFALAIGAALAPAPAAIGVIAGAVLTPQLARIVLQRFDPKRRAIGHLQTLL